MGWTFEYAGLRLAEDELTAAEQASIVTLANQSYPHAELEVHPQHCQVCRNAITVTAALAAGIPMPAAIGLLSQLTAEESVTAFMARRATDSTSPPPNAPEDRFEQRFEQPATPPGTSGPGRVHDADQDLDGAGVAAVV